MDRAHDALQLVAAALGHARRGAVLDVDDQVRPLSLRFVERPSREQPQYLGRDASALGRPGDDVAQLELTTLATISGANPSPTKRPSRSTAAKPSRDPSRRPAS
jgi:hypothetical protein